MNVNGYNVWPGADLREADLGCADLRWADLREADLRRADLRCADLRGADLRCADLRGADLRCADLREANLREAELEKAQLPHYQIPQEGSLVVWKKLQHGLARLLVPAAAKRTTTLVGRKCRAEYALVLSVATSDGVDFSDLVRPCTRYVAGEIVRPDDYDPDPRVECSHGIHFFLTREEAEEF